MRPEMLTWANVACAGLTKALCRSAGDGELPNVLMLLAHLATTQTQLADVPPAVLEVCICTQCKLLVASTEYYRGGGAMYGWSCVPTTSR